MTSTTRNLLCVLAAVSGACSADPTREHGVVGTYRTPARETSSAGQSGAEGPTKAESTPAGAAPQAPRAPASLTPVVIDRTGRDNPAGLSDSEVGALEAGGPLGTMKWLYPYEGTVFPNGMHAPYVMWEGEMPDVVYVRLKSKTFDYKVVVQPVIQSGLQTASWGLNPMMAMQFGLPLKPQVQFPADVWELACQHTQGKNDPFTLELTARAQGKIAGPITLHFTIAQGGVKGSIYYTAYGSMVPPAGFYGKLLRLRDGKPAELAAVGDNFSCAGCHSVSANGGRVIWQEAKNWWGGQGFTAQLDPASAAVAQGVPTGLARLSGRCIPTGQSTCPRRCRPPFH